MKIRTGFVSNSSSSSFTCDFCRNDVSGWDLSLEEAEMSCCENGHTVCDDHLVGDPYDMDNEQKKQLLLDYKWIEDGGKEKLKAVHGDDIKKLLLEDEGLNDDLKDIMADMRLEGVPPEFCPICQFKILDDDTALKYLMKELGYTRSGLLSTIRDKFATYDDLKKYINGD